MSSFYRLGAPELLLRIPPSERELIFNLLGDDRPRECPSLGFRVRATMEKHHPVSRAGSKR